MNVLRRAWRVWFSPARSVLAYVLQVFLPLWIAAIVLRYAYAGVADVSALPTVDRLTEAVWAYVALWLARQRDEARAGVKVRTKVAEERRGQQ